MTTSELKTKLQQTSDKMIDLSIRRKKLDRLHDEMKELTRHNDIVKLIDYVIVCFNIAICINNAQINKQEMLKTKIEELLQVRSKYEHPTYISKTGSMDPATQMKRRYEDARRKLLNYQHQIEACYRKKISLDNEFNSITESNIAGDNEQYSSSNVYEQPKPREYSPSKSTIQPYSPTKPYMPKSFSCYVKDAHKSYTSLRRNNSKQLEKDKHLLLSDSEVTFSGLKENPVQNRLSYEAQKRQSLDQLKQFHTFEEQSPTDREDPYTDRKSTNPLSFSSFTYHFSNPYKPCSPIATNFNPGGTGPVQFTDEHGLTSAKSKQSRKGQLVLRDRLNFGSPYPET